jgi:hypothetical protein
MALERAHQLTMCSMLRWSMSWNVSTAKRCVSGALLLSSVLATNVVRGQRLNQQNTLPEASQVQPRTVSAEERLDIAHHLFFRSAAVVSHRIASLERDLPSTGQPLLRAFAAKLGLSTVEAAQYLRLAAEVSAQLDLLDQQAATMIAATKKRRLAGGLIPPPPAELSDLEARRRSLIAQGRLRIAALGPSIARQVEAYVRQSPSQTSSLQVSER